MNVHSHNLISSKQPAFLEFLVFRAGLHGNQDGGQTGTHDELEHLSELNLCLSKEGL